MLAAANKKNIMFIFYFNISVLKKFLTKTYKEFKKKKKQASMV